MTSPLAANHTDIRVSLHRGRTEPLSKIDSQGDILRNGIIRATKVREAKKRAVQVSTLESALSGIGKANPELGTLLGDILTSRTPQGRLNCTTQQVTEFATRIVALFADEPAGACLMLCLLAVLSDNTAVKLQALEYIDIWTLRVREPQGLAKARSYAHLAHFGFSDTPTAIEQAEDALTGLSKIQRPLIDASEEELLKRRENSLYSSLAYYHAEIVGSDEGNKRSSQTLAKDYALRSINKLVDLKLLGAAETTIEGNVEVMLKVTSTPDYSGPLFHSIDNLIFVLLQTATNLVELQRARALLDRSLTGHPPALGSLPHLLWEFHSYCGRQRLTELELQDVDG